MLARVLEPEVMEGVDEALAYDAMDHAEVNERFVDDLLAAGLPSAEQSDDAEPAWVDLLDLGTGTAQIPILLCQRRPDVRIIAVDLGESMLDVARRNLEFASLTDRVALDRVDAKTLPYHAGQFAGVICNSLVHHLAEPRGALAEMLRVTRPGGLIFVRDLVRPAEEATLAQQVATYAADATDRQRELFADSLRAALTLEELRELLTELSIDPLEATLTSDRHWTWAHRRSG